MKKFACLTALLFAALPLFCQSPATGKPVVLPDLVCYISRSGNNVVVKVINAPHDTRGCGRSTASVTIGSATQNVAVPELGPEGEFEKIFPIPPALLAGPIKVTVKVDALRKINESNENNNSCSETLNQPDLEPVLIPGHAILAVRTDAQFLYFSVKNTGDGNAAASTAQFVYYLAGGQKQAIRIPTPPIPAGKTVELRVSPNTCSSRPPSGDCRWYGKADTDNVIRESDENNNLAEGGTAG